ncbi:amino acid adenylation domain-containing protein [Fibrella sp. USSR17]
MTTTADSASYPTDKTLVDLFTEQVSLTPDNTAVVLGTTQLTYLELDRQSTQLAHRLRTLGVVEETLVPICLDRSIAMIIGLLGILKAGGAYVPIDPDYPAERIAYMLTDTQAKVLVTDRASRSKLAAAGSDTSIVCLDDPEAAITDEPVSAVSTNLKPGNLAYIIYTSGSTGRPKGVQIEHTSVVSLLKPTSPLFDFTDQDVWTMFHSFCFDFSVWEMYGALLFGGRLVIVPKHVAKDASLFGALLSAERVTVLNQTPSAFYVLQEQIASRATSLSVRYVIFGGEALNPAKLKPWHERFPACQLINMYGITETTVHVTYLALTAQHLAGTSSLIGRPIPTLSAHVLSSDQAPVAIGDTGELYVGGAGLARGYLNRPELTAQRFIPHPASKQPGDRLYRSGDLVRLLDDGELEYMGRIDEQVKIRGYRIELGEVEHAIQQFPGVKHAVVVARSFADSDIRLVGFIVADGPVKSADLTTFLSTSLPEYMIPSLLIPIGSMPLTGNGKVDRKTLLSHDVQATVSSEYIAPGNPTEEKLSAVWKEVLASERIGVNDNFFELGGNSLLAVRTMAAVGQALGQDIPVTKLYQFPTLRALAGYLDGRTQSKLTPRTRRPTQIDSGEVAVIGMAGRFPGANTIDALWDLLREGRETVRFFSDSELDPALPAELTRDPAYVKARGILDQADQFDPGFFGLNTKLAEVMDPQQRIFLEIAWEALEHAGYLPQQYGGSIGVWAGCGNNTYYLNNVLANQQVVNQVGSFQAMTVNEKDFIASRTAYQLNLNGPAVSVFSACSTSLLAITQAVDSLRLGHCELALAGGASITAPIHSGHLYEAGAMLSKDGHCRPFDASATGTLFSDGAGVVLLKSRQAAERDGDTIYAVIKGVGVNNDGGGKGSFTAPNANGQAGAIRMALDDARVEASTISYVEAHGTATPLGDPIEIEGLSLAFGDVGRKQFCALGSIKSNMGHLTAAAGVAGFIKTTLALYHKQLPASLGYNVPNPVINFADSPFYVNDTHTDWTSTAPRRAGVSSFGVGGTNVHVVLEESAQPQPAVDSTKLESHRPMHLVTWSAKSDSSLTAYGTQLAAHLHRYADLNVPDVAYTLQRRYPSFAHRRFVLASSREELLHTLATPPTAASTSRPENNQLHAPGELVFLFPGQGAQYVNMGRALYEHEPVYKQAIDTCAEYLLAYLDTDIRAILYPAIVDQLAQDRLTDTRFTQPALFVTEYALARLWQSWGVEPTVFCGHSIGEFVAAHLAGIFSLPDALALIASRGKLISNLPAGDMLSVRLDVASVTAMLPATLSLAAVNSKKLCVVAGTAEAIASFSAQLTGQGIPNRLLATSHAFHSAMIDPIVGEFEQIVQGISLNRPTKPIVSTVTGTWLTDAEATSARYWATHMRATVQFADALETLFTLSTPLFLEAGPGTVTSTLARQQAIPRPISALASLDTSKGSLTDYESMLTALGQLWTKGIDPDWTAFSAEPNRQRVALPTYAFDRKRCWVNPARPLAPPINPAPVPEQTEPATRQPEDTSTMRKTHLLTLVNTLLNETSGIEADQLPATTSFLEMGLDSLALTQFSYNLRKKFSLPISFRQLNDEFSTPNDLVAYLDHDLPADAFRPAMPVAQPPTPAAVPGTLPTPKAINGHAPQPTPPVPYTGTTDASSPLVSLIEQQLQIMAQQLAALRGQEMALPTQPPVSQPTQPVSPAPAAKPTATPVAAEKTVVKQAFGAGARIERQASALNATQQAFIQQLTDRYTKKTGASKQYAQEHRRYMADPRAVTGFRPLTKELVYPIVVDSSKGSRLWDIDGNEYIDALNGFGSTMFGYQPDVLKAALHDQIEKGYELGPQHKLAGEVTRMICEFTGFDRAALCNTGSEAVLGAIRMARTVTGRSLIVTFAGSYHGIFDEVISRGGASHQATPAALGIPTESVQNILILDYGTDASLQIIRERAHELAAVLVEPVQSRRPEFQPVDFLREVRAITEATQTALIFDEVITGFRMHPGGAQALFGIRADLATYGKVVGGGLPIGVVAGKARFMDALDGGYWQYGDDSYPQADLTFFAGTFVRHPLALAAAMASLQHMREQGPALQERLTASAKQLADKLTLTLAKLQLPLVVGQFGSLWKLKYTQDVPYGELLFTLMREKGIHIWDGFPCFMTEAHTDADINQIAQAFADSLQELISAQFLVPKGPPLVKLTDVFTDLKKPPVPNARLGRDKQGNPAWFVSDPAQPGKYLQLV